jgi:polyisoprenoid-binding protein YceI
MRIFRNSVAVTIITVLILAIIGLTYESSTASAQAAPAQVTYAPVESGAYDFDKAHAIIGFGVRHLGIALVEGRFKDFAGTVNYDAKDVTRSNVEFTAKIASVDTGVAPRDEHLRSADFFEAAKYPEMTFKSTAIEKRDSDYVLTGDLTIKGVTKRISFPFTMTGAIKDPWGGTRFGIEASTSINRRDFGVNFGSRMANGALDVADEVVIDLHIEAVKQQPKSAE